MRTKKTYKQLQGELDELLDQLQSVELDIDKALILHKEGEKLVAELEEYLTNAKDEIEHLKGK